MKLFSIFNPKAHLTAESQFWSWFETEEDMVFHTDDQSVLEQLQSELSKVDPGLVCELCAIRDDGKREFIISAGGIKRIFPVVEKLCAEAPELLRWDIIKFRQKKELPAELVCGDMRLKPEEIYYNLYKDMNKLGIAIFFVDFNHDDKERFKKMGYLLLETTLGEYDVATKLDFIEFYSIESPHAEGAKPFTQLAVEVTKYARD